jgi:serine phosphatase RsbU (regulator of sigma subunit)
VPRSHVHLDPTGPLLGLRGAGLAPAFGVRDLPYSASDLLAIVTDGITEARRREGERLEFFGASGVARVVYATRECRWDTAKEIQRAALAHAGNVLYDDATAVVSTL